MKKVKKFVNAAVLLVLAFIWGGIACAADLPKVFPAFSSKNLEDKSVTESVFSREKLTMVNIWTTWCPPCIREMPDLGNLADSMPAGSQMIGIVLDIEDSDDTDTIANAKKILSKAKANFPQILPAEGMSSVLEWVEAIPTTIFVDSKGKIVGKPLVGSRSGESYRSEIEKILKTIQ